MYRLYTPRSLDIETKLKKADKYKKRKKHIERYKYVVSFIVYNQHFGKNKKKTNPYINICQGVMRQIIGRSLYKEIFNDLQAWGIIECDGKAKPNSKCLGFRLSKPHYEDLIKEDFVVDSQLWNNIKRHTLRKITALFKSQPHLVVLIKYLQRVEIDYKSAKRFIEANHKNQSKKYNSRMLAIGKIHEGDFHFTRDAKGKRLHTNISSFPKDLRKFLIVKDLYTNNKLNLVEIDIKNSQPLFLLVYLIKYHSQRINRKELSLYRKIIRTGFYEFFMKNLAIQNRDQVKEGVFKGLLYNDTIRSRLTPYEMLFKENFPSIFDCLLWLKRNNYRLVSYKMQEVEARFIIDTVAKIYSEKYPLGFLATIHDSVILPEQHANQIKNLMEGKLKRLYNIDVMLHVNSL
jgi:hypothetical protein